MNAENKLSIIMRYILSAAFIVLLNFIGCTASDGRDFGGTIWGSTSSATELPVGNALISLDEREIFAVTQSDGYFSIKGIPEGSYDLTLTKYGVEIFKGSTSVNRSVTSVSDGNERQSGAVTFFQFPGEMKGDRDLACTVLNQIDEPVVDAEIDLIYQQGKFFHVTKTDQAGSFYLSELHPNPDVLIIDAKGYKPAIFNSEQIYGFMDNGPEGAMVNLIPLEPDTLEDMAPKGSVTGSIVDTESQLLAGISVALYKVDPEIAPVMSVARILKTDIDGAFKFEDIEPGEYVVWVGHPNYFPDDMPVTIEDGVMRTVTFTLDEATDKVAHPYLRPSQP